MVLVLISCNSERLNQDTPAMNQGIPDETSYDITITEYNGDRIDYTLDAKKIERFYDRRLIKAYGVILQDFDDLGRLNSTVKGDTITVDEARNVVIANGNVILNSANGRVAAPLLVWDRNVDEIFAPQNVTLIRGDDVLRGNNLRTDIKVSFAEMNTVSADGRINEKEFNW